MGDLPAAGKYLYVTESWETGDGAVREAFEERYGRSAADRLRALPASPPLAAYPPEVDARLGRLVADAREEGYPWEPKAEVSVRPPAPLLGWKGRAVAAAFALLTVGVWILGVVFLFQLVF